MVSKITLSFKKRAAAERGLNDSNLLNDLINEVSHDLISITRQWNSIAYPIFSSLPQGETDTRWELDASLDPVTNGLDGTQMFMDNDATATLDDGRFFDSSAQRPKTLKETSESLQTQINEINEAVQLIEVLGAEGLTEEQKSRIGLNVFNPFQVSSPTSIDGRSKRNEFNITQLAKDIYGPLYTLDGDGEANLVNPIRDMVDGLLELHGGNWDDDATLLHSIVNADVAADAYIAQTKIDQSSSYVGLGRLDTVDNLQDDLNRIRNEIGALRGNALWNEDFSNTPYSGAPVSLQGHVASVGTGTASATNPHGLRAVDIGLGPSLTAIYTFVGMDNETDSTPDYANNFFITQNATLESNIGRLDAQLKTTNDNLTTHLAITNGNPHGVDMEDFAANTVIDRINLATNYINADRLVDGVFNCVPTLIQEANWDGHLVDTLDAHPASAISVVDTGLNNFSGDDVQEALESIDLAFTNRRLEVTFAGHNSDDPIIVNHNKGIYPIVQLVDTSQQELYIYTSTVSDEVYTSVYVNIEHLDTNTFRVWTNATDGVIVALF